MAATRFRTGGPLTSSGYRRKLLHRASRGGAAAVCRAALLAVLLLALHRAAAAAAVAAAGRGVLSEYGGAGQQGQAKGGDHDLLHWYLLYVLSDSTLVLSQAILADGM